MDLFSHELPGRIGEQNFLRKLDRLLDWAPLVAIVDKGLDRSGYGPRGYGSEVLLRCLILGQFHGLSDPQLEESLNLRLDFLWFSKLDPHGSVPDETCHCRFRNHLVRADVFDDLLDQVNA